MLSQGANYTVAFRVKEKNTCPLLDDSLMMLCHDMAYVENYNFFFFLQEIIFLSFTLNLL